MLSGRTMLMRVDATSQIGTGHVMRCIALAQGFRRAGGTATFALHQSSDGAIRAVSERGFATTEVEAGAAAFDRLLSERRPDVVVVDGYHFGDDFQNVARDRGKCSILVDDLADRPSYDGDLVVNGNVFGADLSYPATTRTKVLAGPAYALLREEFVFAPTPHRVPGRTVLFTFGGADPLSLSESAVEALARTERSFDGIVLVGPAHPRSAKLAAALAKAPHVTLLRDVPDVRALLAQVDVAIAAAGSTCLELAFMGVPAFVVATAPNQRPVADKLAALGAAEDLGDPRTLDWCLVLDRVDRLLDDDLRRRAMAHDARQLIDGRGADRVTQAVAEVLR